MLDVTNPTQRTYTTLDDAFRYFNEHLFGGRLPPCLLTMQRKARVYGYFAGNRFGSADGKEVTDEIALNPSHFRRTTTESLSTLVHEMTHLEQHHFGKPGRGGYHNKEWGRLMRAVGLIPSDTAEPGGKDVGQQMTHYIEAGGLFDIACADLLAEGFAEFYVDLWGTKRQKAKTASKTRYSCPRCQSNAWAKPQTKLICGACCERMIALDAA